MIGGNRVDYFRDTLVKRAFIGGATRAAIAGQYSRIQLWNPAASEKCLIISKISITVGIISGITIRHHNAALANPETSGNKYLGEAAPDGVVYRDTNVALVGTFFSRLDTFQANLYYPLSFDRNPFIVPPGLGLVIIPAVQNIDFDANFEWIEAG